MLQNKINQQNDHHIFLLIINLLTNIYIIFLIIKLVNSSKIIFGFDSISSLLVISKDEKISL